MLTDYSINWMIESIDWIVTVTIVTSWILNEYSNGLPIYGVITIDWMDDS